MARRKPPEEHDNHERWLVSYADFITLLFAFFVVMYAISSVNDGKYRVLSDSLVSAFKETPRSEKMIELTSRQGEILPGSGKPIGKMQQQPHGDADTPERERAAESMKQVARNVLDVMQPLVRDGQVRVTQSPRGVTVEINASVLFATAHLQWLAAVIAGLAYGWLYLRTRDIWATALSHAVTNFILGLYVLSEGAHWFWA